MTTISQKNLDHQERQLVLKIHLLKVKKVISGFRCNVDENCALLGYYAAACNIPEEWLKKCLQVTREKSMHNETVQEEMNITSTLIRNLQNTVLHYYGPNKWTKKRLLEKMVTTEQKKRVICL
jgi:hypothetical protein